MPLFDFPRCTATELRFKPGPCVLNYGETCGADGPASLIKGTWRFFGVHLPHRVSGGCRCNCSPVRLLQEMECGDVRTGVCFLCVPSPSFSLLCCTLTWNCVFPSSCHHPTRDPTVSGSLWPPAVCALEMKNLPSALTSCWDRDFRLLGFTSMVFCLWVLV